MGVFGSIVEPAAAELTALDTDLIHRSALGGQAVGHDGFGPVVALHRTLEKRQRRLAIAALRGEDLQHLTFVIDGSPEIVRLAIDLHEDFVQMPAPLRNSPQAFYQSPSDLRSKHGSEAVPPEPHSLVADINPAFEEQVLDLPQREGIADVEHHREADYLRRAVEIAERISHRRRLRTGSVSLKPICFDTALKTIRVDQGPKFIFKDLDLWAWSKGVTLDFWRPSKPTDNAFVEPFNGKVRAEYIDQNWYLSLDDAKSKCGVYGRDYNEDRPHSAIGNKTPMELMKSVGQASCPTA